MSAPDDQRPVGAESPAARGAARVELRVSQLRQLFNSLDPSPFHEKDIDTDAEEYIVSSAREQASDLPISIIIHMPAEEAAHANVNEVGTSLRNYFLYREEVARRELRYTLRLGRWRLAIGLAVLFLCVGLREVILGFSMGAAGRVLAEGLLIGGWVAMWQPVQTFLYGWWPQCESLKVLHRLAGTEVEIHPESTPSRH
jgi:hypothetical protein